MKHRDENTPEIMNDIAYHHLMNADWILQAALDISDRASQQSLQAGEIKSHDRFHSIAEFIRLYRTRMATVLDDIVPCERKAA